MFAEDSSPLVQPLVRVVDLDVGEIATVELCDGTEASLRLVGVDEQRDEIRGAIRRSVVTVEVNGEQATIETGMYNLPRAVGGVQIDCTVTAGYNENGTPAFWGLDKDARLRLWPADSPWIRPGSFRYPVKQKWFATMTWYDNEPVDGGATILPRIYYHAGLDIGGSEALTEVIAATDALVVSVGEEVLDRHADDTPVSPRYDVVYLLDERGWYYRYSHLHTIDEAIKPGRTIDQGTLIGLIGKEGASGGWTHLHFEIKARQPSGKWGTQAGYAFIWQAYLAEHNPDVIAVARPQQFVRVGDVVTLDGSRSWCRSGDVANYDWTFGDGTTAKGPTVERTYDRPGTYSEILKVTDANGNFDYDFAMVQVIAKDETQRYAPRLHAVYHPTMNIRSGDPVTFKVRSFNVDGPGEEVWNFGDGSEPVTVQSDGNSEPRAANGYAVTTHAFEKPGDYLVKVERMRADGVKAVAHLHVRVDE
ncbi:MAG: PKD domain-containing protein [Planctomycetota bacterium]|nr:MAG: PKD domain-containing protein [Planctomycetota bacterium]